MLAEALGTFLLCFTVHRGDRPATGPEHPGSGLAIGLALARRRFAFGGVSGGSFNFARTFGPELVARWPADKSVWGHDLGLPASARSSVPLSRRTPTTGLTAARTATPAPATPAKAAPKQKARR